MFVGVYVGWEVELVFWCVGIGFGVGGDWGVVLEGGVGEVVFEEGVWVGVCEVGECRVDFVDVEDVGDVGCVGFGFEVWGGYGVVVEVIVGVDGGFVWGLVFVEGSFLDGDGFVWVVFVVKLVDLVFGEESLEFKFVIVGGMGDGFVVEIECVVGYEIGEVCWVGSFDLNR